ncbi:MULTISPECIES: sulfurtransferase TusA family protein [Francisella]|uniref:Recombinase n=1 Tax=Francisella adeliensis TaxID=2007306 RepID=A0A2Z4XZR9_9GAMM|nr:MULTISPECIES: sulfurtransferase TusA family protein [Francisella]AXA33992.1 recombinase [Francisella adeliensis]MBK2085904.1 sulfurtransferase TusA family protein [Francisella adeliensis]MBK2097782.1 sulfurtransferase TusA family protein [Francisella adeliensis]QIW12229.1 sulfurtransferase TusA family protein [Francisella adeliensis]QIW14105.1 sulfurtransferase TusA family protein [Francisella adeliensis]
MKELNLERLLCPMPVIKTQNMLKTMDSGEKLKVVCTDPGTMFDIPAWCRVNDYRLIKAQEEQQKFEFIIEVK